MPNRSAFNFLLIVLAIIFSFSCSQRYDRKIWVNDSLLASYILPNNNRFLYRWEAEEDVKQMFAVVYDTVDYSGEGERSFGTFFSTPSIPNMLKQNKENFRPISHREAVRYVRTMMKGPILNHLGQAYYVAKSDNKGFVYVEIEYPELKSRLRELNYTAELDSQRLLLIIGPNCLWETR